MVGAAVARIVPSRFSMKNVPATRSVSASCLRSFTLCPGEADTTVGSGSSSAAALDLAMTLLTPGRSVGVVVDPRGARLGERAQLRLREHQVGGSEVVRQLFDGARTENGRRDGRLGDQPGERDLRRRAAGLLCNARHGVDDVPGAGIG